jgi:hypothetical protein
MHLKVFLKLENPKISLFWVKKTKKNPLGWFFYIQKNPGFFQPWDQVPGRGQQLRQQQQRAVQQPRAGPTNRRDKARKKERQRERKKEKIFIYLFQTIHDYRTTARTL